MLIQLLNLIRDVRIRVQFSQVYVKRHNFLEAQNEIQSQVNLRSWSHKLRPES